MNKKAIAYEFLLRLIIAILFVGAALYIGKSLFRLTGSGFDSYLGFVSEANRLENGQFKELGVDFDKNTAIIGFSKDAEQFECYNCISPSVDNKPRAIFKKPIKPECKNRACICLCREGLSDKESGATTEFSCSSLTCRNLKDDLDVIDIYDATKENQPGLKAFWKGGFVYGRDIKAALNNMENYLPRTRVLRIENYNNLIVACSSGKKECLSSEAKTELDKRMKEKKEKELRVQSEKAFGEFINFLNKCKEDASKCGAREFIGGYNIFYIPTTKPDHGIYLLKKPEPDLKPDVDMNRDLVVIDGKKIKSSEIPKLNKNENEEFSEDNIFKSNKAEFNYKNGNIIVIQ